MKEVTSKILTEQKEIDELKKQIDASDDEANHISEKFPEYVKKENGKYMCKSQDAISTRKELKQIFQRKRLCKLT